MLIPFKKLAFSLCAILLLGQNANAGWLDEVQKIQNALNQTDNQQGEQAQQSQAQEQESQVQNQQVQDTTPKFNSLAEEKAYKKKQEAHEQQVISDEQQYVYKNLVPRIKQFRASEIPFYKKYLVNDSDTLDIIDSKFKNRVQLVKEMQKDIQSHDIEASNINDIITKNYTDREKKVDYVRILQDQHMYTTALPIARGSGVEVPTMYIGNQNNNGYILFQCHSTSTEDLTPAYENYLKKAYEDYDGRQQKLKQANDAKEQQALWQKENKKVQKVCNVWIAKAHKKVYSLGVGDKISCGTSLVYTIQAQNANTFTVLEPYFNQYVYKQKSECLPSPMPAAPSQYCQQAR